MKTVMRKRVFEKTNKNQTHKTIRALALVLLILLIVPAVFSQPQPPKDASSQIAELEAKVLQSQQEAARTERQLRTYLFPAFVVVWLALFLYMRILSRKERELEQTIEGLQARLNSQSRN